MVFMAHIIMRETTADRMMMAKVGDAREMRKTLRQMPKHDCIHRRRRY